MATGWRRGPEAAAAQERLAQVQQACIRQRELLVRAVRKGAQLEATIWALGHVRVPFTRRRR